MNTNKCCTKRLKEVIKSDVVRILVYTIGLIIISLIIIFCISSLVPSLQGFFDDDTNYPLHDFHNAFFILLTAMIAIIAWVQLKGLYENSKADMLLRIDKSLRNAEAIKAMTIIRQFRFEVEKEIVAQNDIKINFSEIKKQHKKEIEEKTGQKIKKFLLDYGFQHEQVVLINFLNTIETICYLCNKNYASSDDVEEFFENELPSYFDIFEPYIQYVQESYDSKDGNEAYSEFKGIVKKIRCRD